MLWCRERARAESMPVAAAAYASVQGGVDLGRLFIGSGCWGSCDRKARNVLVDLAGPAGEQHVDGQPSLPTKLTLTPPLLTKWSLTTRLETRTKESNNVASIRVANSQCAIKVKACELSLAQQGP